MFQRLLGIHFLILQTYSLELEQLAIDWVKRCDFHHPDKDKFPAYKGIGQNLGAIGGVKPTLVQLAKPWFNEVKHYTYSTKKCAKACGHYTQVGVADIMAVLFSCISFIYFSF